MPEISEAEIVQLKERAIRVSKQAYCPYSNFCVGAAILTASGEIFAGCNVENASYGLAICAERNAVFQMVASGGNRIAAVVIYTPTLKPTSPCGACRQVINEFGPAALVISICDGPDEIRQHLNELLPRAFGLDPLK